MMLPDAEEWNMRNEIGWLPLFGKLPNKKAKDPSERARDNAPYCMTLTNDPVEYPLVVMASPIESMRVN